MSIPLLGLGTYLIPDEHVTDVILQGFDIGYRHVDTAQIYENERGIGKALKNSTLARDQYRLTTKVWINNYTTDRCRASIQQSLKNLQTDYIDLVLLHRPNTRLGHHEVLDTLMLLQQEQKIRHIGVSNFPIASLEDACTYTGNTIFTNQIELHPLFDPVKIRTYCHQHHILLSCYSPFAHGAIFDNETLNQLAKKHDRSVSQVALAWSLLVSGGVVIPKATTYNHLQDNFLATSLALDAEDMASIAKLPKDQRRCNPVFHPLWDE